MQTNRSAFTPVMNYECYEFYIGFDKITRSPSISNEEVSKTPRNKKWTMDEKLVAVRVAKKLGISKAIHYLHNNNPKEFSRLSISTLKYWVEQSKGRKKRYYD